MAVVSCVVVGCVGVGLRVGAGAGVSVGSGVGVRVGVRVRVGVGIGVGIAEGAGVGASDGVEVGDDVVQALLTIPFTSVVKQNRLLQSESCKHFLPGPHRKHPE